MGGHTVDVRNPAPPGMYKTLVNNTSKSMGCKLLPIYQLPFPDFRTHAIVAPIGSMY